MLLASQFGRLASEQSLYLYVYELLRGFARIADDAAESALQLAVTVTAGSNQPGSRSVPPFDIPLVDFYAAAGETLPAIYAAGVSLVCAPAGRTFCENHMCCEGAAQTFPPLCRPVPVPAGGEGELPCIAAHRGQAEQQHGHGGQPRHRGTAGGHPALVA